MHDLMLIIVSDFTTRVCSDNHTTEVLLVALGLDDALRLMLVVVRYVGMSVYELW
jgi:hypothetical protein